MQTSRNLFLWQGGGLVRKGLEAYFTLLLELFWPKARIMEVYLNIAEWGTGVFGAEAASRAYFNRPACTAHGAAGGPACRGSSQPAPLVAGKTKPLYCSPRR